MRFNKCRCKVLHLGRGNPHYQHKLRDERIDYNADKKYLGVLVDGKLDMKQPVISWVLSKEKWPAHRGRGCPFLYAGETSPMSRCGILSKGETWTCWRLSRGGHKNDPMNETPPLKEQAEKIGGI